MREKCCCGCCTLSTGAAIALTLSAIQAMIGLLWNVELLMRLNKSEIYNPLYAVIDDETIDNFDVVHGLTLAAIGLNGFWLMFAILAGRGNITLNYGQMAFWDVFTYLITFFDIGAIIYFGVKLQAVFVESSNLYIDDKPSKTLTNLTLFVAFSKGGILPFINIYLAHVVQLRRKEIHHDHSVLAFYIISHLARCNGANENGLLQPTQASARSTSYAPGNRNTDLRSDSNGSQWSLSYEAIQGMSQEPPLYLSPSGKNMFPSLELARALSRTCSATSEANLNMHTDTSPILPY